MRSLCMLCHAVIQRRLDLCDGCESDFAIAKNTCLLCAAPLTALLSEERYCGTCLKSPPPYDRLWVPFLYQKPLDHLIMRLKFYEQLAIAKSLGLLLASKLSHFYQDHPLPQSIIPMPLHRSRLRERGYNQALELARPIARQLKIPLQRFQVIRHRATRAQSLLPANERAENVKNAFAVQGKISGTIAVIDDVITTGNTLAELCRCLRSAGAQHIDVWCCAKA